MSNEEQVADTIEMLYERLNGYNKQDLFNYGYLLESNQILCKDIEEKDKEIERLNHECDTYLKIATKRGNIIDELEKWLERIYDKEYIIEDGEDYCTDRAYGCKVCLDKLNELKGDNNEETI